jgi:hypothetical protein
VFQQGVVDMENGQIDEAGAISIAPDTGAGDPAPFMAWEFVVAGDPTAVSAGTSIQFAIEPGEGTATVVPEHFALVGSGDPVAWDQVAMGAAEVDLFFGDMNGDSLVNHFDLALWQVQSGQTADDAEYNRLYDFDSDGTVGRSDLDLLLGVMYRPVTTPVGHDDLADSADDSEDTESDSLADETQASQDLLALDALFASDPLAGNV